MFAKPFHDRDMESIGRERRASHWVAWAGVLQEGKKAIRCRLESATAAERPVYLNLETRCLLPPERYGQAPGLAARALTKDGRPRGSGSGLAISTPQGDSAVRGVRRGLFAFAPHMAACLSPVLLWTVVRMSPKLRVVDLRWADRLFAQVPDSRISHESDGESHEREPGF